MSRERDVRNAIQARLIDTGAFDPEGVVLFAPEDRGFGTDVAACVWIDPIGSAIRDEWDSGPDGGITITAQLRMTFAYRADDAQARDEGVEALVQAAFRALNGKILVEDFTIPAWTKFDPGWSWALPTSAERQIISTFSYQYIVEGWNAFDTSE